MPARRLSNGLRGLVGRGPIELGASGTPGASSHLGPEATSAPLPINMVYVRLSRAFLCQYTSPATHQRVPITDEILGTAVHGTSTTTTLTALTLTPDANLGAATCGSWVRHISTSRATAAGFGLARGV